MTYAIEYLNPRGPATPPRPDARVFTSAGCATINHMGASDSPAEVCVVCRHFHGGPSDAPCETCRLELRVAALEKRL